MGRVLRFLKWATQPRRRSGKPRPHTRNLSVSPPAGLRTARTADVAVGQSPTSRRLAIGVARSQEQLRCLGSLLLRAFLDQLRFRDPRRALAESSPRGLRPGQLHVRRPLQRDLLCRDPRRRSRPDHRHRRRLRLSHRPERPERFLDLLWPADVQRQRAVRLSRNSTRPAARRCRARTPPVQATTTGRCEESLDIEWAHAMAPMANIILFEATNDTGNMGAISSLQIKPPRTRPAWWPFR